MPKALPVLQSGFVSLHQKGLVLPDPIEPTLRAAVVFKDYKSPLQKYFYSQEVTEIYHAWLTNSDVLKKFEFRERLLKAAFASFYTTDVFEWFESQALSPVLGDLHRVFLIETLEYLFAGRDRLTAISQWTSLLEADKSNPKLILGIDRYFNRNHREHDPKVLVTRSMVEMIKIWSSKEGGFADLLVSLYVIFGQRTDRTAGSFSS
jgi:hypothetical protein